MVRVAGLHDQIDAGIEKPRQDGRTPTRDDRRDPRARARARRAPDALPRARAAPGARRARHPHRRRTTTLDDDERARARRALPAPDLPGAHAARRRPRAPVPVHLQPLAVASRVLVRDPVTDQTSVRAREGAEGDAAALRAASATGRTFVPLEDVIADHLDALFPGMEIVDYDVFRVTRDADFTVSDEADDLLQAVEDELRRRRFGEVVRVEVGAGMSRGAARAARRARSRSRSDEVYRRSTACSTSSDLWQIVKLPGSRRAARPAVDAGHPAAPAARRGRAARRARPRCARATCSCTTPTTRSRPRSSASSSRPSPTPTCSRSSRPCTARATTRRSCPALIRAAERGKQAVCLVELKARFDERANIHWAQALEEAGVHVVYGLPVAEDARQVRPRRAPRGRRRAQLRAHRHRQLPPEDRAPVHRLRPVHLTDEQIGADVADMFNFLTGYAPPAQLPQGAGRARPPARRDPRARSSARSRRTREGTAGADRDEDELARRPARASSALYRASQAGVPVDLNVRGICCLRPGVPGVSENIRVVSIVGRFLEHSRIYAFERDGDATRSTSARPT